MQTDPQVATRSCDSCRKWQYNEDTGEIAKHRGELYPRVGPVPCDLAKGCAKGHYTNPKELTNANKKFIDRYYEWKATGRFPDDVLVSRFSGLLCRLLIKYREG